jgi:uncharacterized membrane protein
MKDLQPAAPIRTSASVEVLISGLLRLGVTVSLITILAGLILMFLHHHQYLTSSADLQRLTQPGTAVPHTIDEVIRGVLRGHGQATVALGLIILIWTPIVRVAVSVVVFFLEQDRFYVAVTTTVLLVLLASFVLGTAAG